MVMNGNMNKILHGKETKTMSAIRCSHSGDFGDLIYSLPLVKVLGGGRYVLKTKLKPPTIREVMTGAKAISLMTLLSQQSYITGVDFDPDDTIIATHDLDEFREYLKPGRSLAQAYFKMYNLDDSILQFPWLTCESKMVAPVVFNRTLRYRNEQFPWKKLYTAHKHEAVFVGTDAEHIDFQNHFGKIPYYHTPTLADLAAVINGSIHFIGNQSAALAIALGLYKRATVEVWPERPDCCLPRLNVEYILESPSFYLME